MNPHASLNDPNLREREIVVSSGLGFHFGRDWSAEDRSVGVNWTVLGEDMMRAVVVTSRRCMVKTVVREDDDEFRAASPPQVQLPAPSRVTCDLPHNVTAGTRHSLPPLNKSAL
jgi:hypothetical protein